MSASPPLQPITGSYFTAWLALSVYLNQDYMRRSPPKYQCPILPINKTWINIHGKQQALSTPPPLSSMSVCLSVCLSCLSVNISISLSLPPSLYLSLPLPPLSLPIHLSLALSPSLSPFASAGIVFHWLPSPHPVPSLDPYWAIGVHFPACGWASIVPLTNSHRLHHKHARAMNEPNCGTHSFKHVRRPGRRNLISPGPPWGPAVPAPGGRPPLTRPSQPASRDRARQDTGTASAETTGL